MVPPGKLQICRLTSLTYMQALASSAKCAVCQALTVQGQLHANSGKLQQLTAVKLLEKAK